MPLKPFRAPSRQTLEFLREAALYGSLGTTLGVGVLLLEERRRRICYLRQVVENGKKLKEFRGKRLVHRCALTDQEIEKLGDGAALTIKLRKSYKTPPEDELGAEEQFRNRRRAQARSTAGHTDKSSYTGNQHTPHESETLPEKNTPYIPREPSDVPMSLRETTHSGGVSASAPNRRSSPAAPRLRKPAHYIGPFKPHKHIYRPPTAARRVPVFSKTVSGHSALIDSSSSFPANHIKEEEKNSILESIPPETPLNDVSAADIASAAKELLAATTPEATLKSFYIYCLRRRRLIDSTLDGFEPIPDYHECNTLEDYVTIIGANLQVLGLEGVLNEFLDLTRDFKTAPSRYVAKLGQILLQLSAEPHLLGTIERIWMKLDQWDVLSLGCYNAVEDACAKLIHLDSIQDILPREQLVLKLLGLLNRSHAKRTRWEAQPPDEQLSTVTWDCPINADQAFSWALKSRLPFHYRDYIRKVFLRLSGSPADTDNNRTLHYRYKWLKTALKSCYQLFAAGKLAPSLQLFNEEKNVLNVTGGLIEELGPDARNLLVKALRQPGYTLVASIVQWLEELGQFDSRAVNSILQYYWKMGQHKMVSDMASKYARSINVHPKLAGMICESYTISDTYDQAISNIRVLCDRLRQCIPQPRQSLHESQKVLEQSFIKILQTRWKLTKNFKAVENAYLFMGLEASESPSISRALLLIQYEAIGTDPYLFMNPTIKLAGQESGDLLPFGPILLKHAKANDWNEVETIMHRVRGLAIHSPQDSTQSTSVFALVFRIYCQSHSFEQAKSYVIDTVDRFGICPSDEILYELLALALKHNSLSSIPGVLHYFRTVTSDVAMDSRGAGRWLRLYWRQFHPASSTLVALLNFLGVHAPELLTQKIGNIYERAQIFEYSKLSNRESQNFLSTPLVSYHPPDMHNTTPDTPKTSLSKIHTWIAQKNWRNVVVYYEWLLKLGRPVTGTILELTIQACLQEYGGDETVALSIIERAQGQGVNADLAMGHILASRINHLSPDPDSIREKISALYKYNDEQNIGMRHFVSVTAARDLLSRGMHRQAVQLMRDTHNAVRARNEVLGIEAMTCWAQAAAEANNVDEFESVLALVIEEGILLDDKFVQAIVPCYHYFKKRRKYHRVDDDQKSLADLWSRISTWRHIFAKRRKAQVQHNIKVGFELCKLMVDDFREATPDHLRNQPSDEFTISKYFDSPQRGHQLESDPFVDYQIPSWEIQDFPQYAPLHIEEQVEAVSHDFYAIAPEQFETTAALAYEVGRELERVETAPLMVAE